MTHEKPDFIWNFDPRFDELLRHYREYRRARGLGTENLLLIRPFICDEKLPARIHIPGDPGAGQISQPDPEQINRIWSRELIAGGEPWPAGSPGVPIVGYTNLYLEESPLLDIQGPVPGLVNRIDSKVEQFRVFPRLGLPFLPFRTAANFGTLKTELDQCLTSLGRFVVMPETSAGGSKAWLIRSPGDLIDYEDRLDQTAPGDKERPFLMTRYIDGVRVPSCNALITEGGKIVILGLTELLFNGLRFDAFIHPAYWPDSIHRQTTEYTLRLGRYLRRRGYRGFFDVDFLLDREDRLFFGELNPRYTFETLYLFSILNHNLFAVMEDNYRQPLIKEPESRVVISKIRPEEHRYYGGPFQCQSSLGEFLLGKTEDFKEYYWTGPFHWKTGSFIGLAGKRFDLAAKRSELMHFYFKSRREFPQ